MSEDNPLSHNLQEYHKAIASEFLKAPTDEKTDEARDKLMTLLPEATKALEQILIAGDTDSVRLNAVKLVFEHTLGKSSNVTAEAELNKLVNSLKPKTDKKSTTDKK